MILMIPMSYFIWKVRNRLLKKRIIRRFLYIAVGAYLAWIITFFGGGFIIWVSGVNVSDLGISPDILFIIFFIIPFIIGGILGEIIGKRRDYTLPYEENK